MKKNFIYPTMALFAAFAATSCSQEKIVSGNNADKITMNVNIPVTEGMHSRTLPTIPEDYELRCIMQLVNATDGTALTGDESYRQTAIVTADNVTFTFQNPEENYKALFWADYVKKGTDQADNIYNTTDLSKVSYNFQADETTKDGLFNSTAADAFYGTAVDGAGNATLSRPFAHINVKPADAVAADYEAYDQLSLEMSVPSGFNVFNGEVTTTPVQRLTYTGAMDEANKAWFSTYVFAGQNTANLGEGNDIKLTLTDSDTQQEEVSIIIAGEDVTIVDNVWGNVNVTPKPDNSSDITVTFPGDETDPNAVQIGDFIYKDGTFGSEYNDNAIAIVFAVGQKAGDQISNYSGFEGKRIAGYAMALNGTNRTEGYKEGDTKDDNTFPTSGFTVSTTATWDIDYNGITYTKNLLSVFENYASKLFVTEFNKFKAENTITSGNVSEWYIPSARQMLDMYGLLLGFAGEENVPAITKNDSYNAAYSKTGKGVYNLGRSVVIYVSSTITSEGGFGCTMQIGTENTDDYTDLSGYYILEKKVMSTGLTGSAAIRPVITIFK